MKAILFAISVLLVLGKSLRADIKTYENKPVYIFSILAPTSSDKLRFLPVHYQGSLLNCNEGYCQLPEPTLRTFFSIIITPRIQFIPKGSQVEVHRIKELPCAWYNLSLALNESSKDLYPLKKSYLWDIEKLVEAQMPLRLPEHASIIIELPPSWVKELEQPKATGPYTIKLPRVVLRNDIASEHIETTLSEAQLDAPERNRNCIRSVETHTCDGNTVILKKTHS